MFNKTNICFKCMHSARSFNTTTCPKCGKEMVALFYKIRIPKKKRKLWNEFADWLSTNYLYYKDKVEKY